MASRAGKQTGDLVHPIRNPFCRTAGDRLPNLCKQRADFLYVVFGQAMGPLARVFGLGGRENEERPQFGTPLFSEWLLSKEGKVEMGMPNREMRGKYRCCLQCCLAGALRKGFTYCKSERADCREQSARLLFADVSPTTSGLPPGPKYPSRLMRSPRRNQSRGASRSPVTVSQKSTAVMRLP